MERKIILDLDLCIGCRSCESACAARFWDERRIRHSEVGIPMKEAFLPSPCRQCEEALCQKACPFGVIRRDEEKGVIFQSSFECVGCSSCILACPFGVMEERLLRHISPKCDWCRDRPDGPRCVATCPTGALRFLTEEEITKEKVGVRFSARSPYWRRV